MRNPRAFTLLEIVVVIAIVGVVAALAFPSIKDSMQKRREEAIASRAQILIEKARDRARTRLTCTYVTYGAACGGASGSGGSGGVGSGEFGSGAAPGALALSTFEYPCDTPGAAYTVRDLYLDAADVSVTLDEARPINFNPAGSVLAGTTADVAARPRTVTLQFASGARRVLEVQPAIGAIRRK